MDEIELKFILGESFLGGLREWGGGGGANPCIHSFYGFYQVRK